VHLEIDTTVKPVQMPPRRPIPIRDRVKAELDSMCKEGFIELVTEPTPWVSALLVVHKPNGELRICIDPKHLNSALKRSVYMMPTMEVILPKLSKARIFSGVDVTKGINHLCLDSASAALTTVPSKHRLDNIAGDACVSEFLQPQNFFRQDRRC